MRVGREICRIGVERRSGILKALRHSIRFLPESKQIKAVLSKYISEAEQRMPSPRFTPRFELREEKACFHLVDKDYHLSNGIESCMPVCNDIVGILQHLLEWITGYKYEIEEIECRAKLGYIFQTGT